MFPANIGLRMFPERLPPHYILGGSALLFGGFLAAMSGAQGYATALSMRILIGSSQAFIQGLGLYSSMWYKRDEVATRGGEFSNIPGIHTQLRCCYKANGNADIFGNFEPTSHLLWRSNDFRRFQWLDSLCDTGNIDSRTYWERTMALVLHYRGVNGLIRRCTGRDLPSAIPGPTSWA